MITFIFTVALVGLTLLGVKIIPKWVEIFGEDSTHGNELLPA